MRKYWIFNNANSLFCKYYRLSIVQRKIHGRMKQKGNDEIEQLCKTVKMKNKRAILPLKLTIACHKISNFVKIHFVIIMMT